MTEMVFRSTILLEQHRKSTVAIIEYEYIKKSLLCMHRLAVRSVCAQCSRR